MVFFDIEFRTLSTTQSGASSMIEGTWNSFRMGTEFRGFEGQKINDSENTYYMHMKEASFSGISANPRLERTCAYRAMTSVRVVGGFAGPG